MYAAWCCLESHSSTISRPRIFGASPAQWRKQRKLDQAKGLLESTREAVTGIGLAVGYDSTSHFISEFKKQFGMTPGQFRAAIDAAGP
ncbi:helix-turn-helix transcriptional regulator [Leisingera sp. F5]|uniref:helix-turn-helix transcriptional regulator n=1 Tax=Leisingera sp. F5 TaxID=1813816 RepID=UPI00345BD205